MASKPGGRDAILVAAIDFGTSYSGYAYQLYTDYKHNPVKIYSPQAWNNGRYNLLSLKTPTCLLLNDKKELDKCTFGFEAEEQYAILCTNKENEKYYFFRRFKMQLQEGKGLTKSSILEDETGKKMLALDVFALSIKCLKNHLMNELDKRGTFVKESDIFWVLTVPAIWNDAAKQFMREAAKKAGVDSEKLEIVNEPEAASLLCQYTPADSSLGGHKDNVLFAAAPLGTKYMVVDLGGGTADITVHEKLEEGRLKEIMKASGGPWGGNEVDRAFTQMLVNIVGDRVMNRFKKEEAYDYLDLLRDFESAKRNFSLSIKHSMIIKLPATLISLCEEMEETSFKTCLQESPHRKQIFLRADKMMIDPTLIEVLFRKVTDHIIHHIKGILETGPGKDISMIVMVGGFSESQFVQEVIREAFQSKNGIQVIIPYEAGITVVKGAVLFGRMPHLIDSRVIRFTYGQKIVCDFDDKIHPEEKKKVTDSGIMCADIFDTIIVADSEVKNGFSITKSVSTANDFQKHMKVEVYTTKDKNPRFTSDSGCKLLGSLRVQIPNPSKGERIVYVTYQFGMTELKVTAVDKASKTPCTTSLIMIE